MTPMSPLERIFTLVWDLTGARRKAQRRRLLRSQRKLRQYDAVNRRAIEQIRRAHEAAAPLARSDH